MRPTLIVALVVLSALALAVPASAGPSSSGCDPNTAPFNECGFNCMPGSGYAYCNNAVQIGACVMLTLRGIAC